MRFKKYALLLMALCILVCAVPMSGRAEQVCANEYVPTLAVYRDEENVAANVFVGDKYKLGLYATRSDTKKIQAKFESNASDIIRVSEDNGEYIMVAISAGTAKIIGTDENSGKQIEFEVIVHDIILGDVTGDGVINTTDAVMVLRYVAGLTGMAGRSLRAADVNKDSLVNTADAVGILKMCVGI